MHRFILPFAKCRPILFYDSCRRSLVEPLAPRLPKVSPVLHPTCNENSLTVGDISFALQGWMHRRVRVWHPF
jgi:hypothetical protein